MSLFDQLPRLSAYDPGAEGEGGLDPLGLAAVADRIANVLAPGIRARMNLPRYVTASAVGAIAYQTLHGLTDDHKTTTVDIAFEWLVVEALVRSREKGRTDSLPGSQKAARAMAANARLSQRTYLSAPRVFGFTGVYRPFSRDAGVLALDDLPSESAARLVGAWERDQDLPGYVDGISGTRGGQFRKDITEACKQTLVKGECAAPPNGQLLRNLANYLAPREAKPEERRVLRELITAGEHEIRNELAAKLVANPPPDHITQQELAQSLIVGTSSSTQRALQAAIDYEKAATVLDNAFRRFLAYTAQQQGSIINPSEALQTPGLSELAPGIGELVQRAIESVEALDDVGLSIEAAQVFGLFNDVRTPGKFFEVLIQRHEEVQANKNKLSWLDQIDGNWTVRTPYRNTNGDLDDGFWTHPMRLVTLAKFLAETA